MAIKFAVREVLVLATEDDCSGRSNSENRESIDGATHAYCGKIRFSTEGLEDVGAVMGEAIPEPGHCSFSTRRISLVAEDELQEEDQLGKQSFVHKAIFQWDTHDIRTLSCIPPDELLKQRLVPLEHRSCIYFLPRAGINFQE